MDLSNKTLAFVLVVAIVISLGGTIISLNKLNQLGATGMLSDSDTGGANFTLTSDIIITFSPANISFGSGSIDGFDAETQYCNITTNATYGWNHTGDCLGSLTNTTPFGIRNDGNQKVSLTLNSSKNATQFIGGTDPVFKWMLYNNETGSCSGTLEDDDTWTVVNAGDVAAKEVCDVFEYETAKNTIAVDIMVAIPENADPGVHSVVLTAVGTA